MPRSPSRAALVVKPWAKTSWARSGATPGPESRTTISTLALSWRSSTSTHGSSPSRPAAMSPATLLPPPPFPSPRSDVAASMALSTRLPTTVATSAASSGVSRSSAVRSERRRATFRSAAWDAFAIKSAATAVSRTRRPMDMSSDWRRWFSARM